MLDATTPCRFLNLRSILVVGLLLLPGIVAAQAPPPMPPEKVVSVYGQGIHYYEAGQGPAVILLHGLGGDGTRWAANLGPLSQQFHVYALDEIGFGNSDKPLIEYQIETFSDFLRGFMEALSIPKATLVGNSLGGWIALDLAIRQPRLVERLVLVDAGGLSPERGAPRAAVDLNPATLAGTRRLLEVLFYDPQRVTDAAVRQTFERRLKSGNGYTIQRLQAGTRAGGQWVDEHLGTIQVPTLVLWGREDRLIPVSVGERFQKAIPGARLVVIPECGHLPQVEKPREFNAALLAFLTQP
jgi:pimeloyl-ACP methyl ester carboxylesterase